MNSTLHDAFSNPSTFYRAAPFWSWNSKLDPDVLLRQIEVFRLMGMGGFHMHPRTGLNTDYLGPDFMDAVRLCVETAKDKGMLAWLYDEDRWPSGAAGGLVTKDARWRARHLLFSPTPYESPMPSNTHVENTSRAQAHRNNNGQRLAIYDITLDSNGCLARYERITEGTSDNPPAGSTRWYAYLEVATPTDWFNGQTYVDTLNFKAIQRFIEVTHEQYKRVIGHEFGKSIPAIFTDEPQFVHKQTLGPATEQRDLVMPFTDDLPETYDKTYGQDLLDVLPELFWELPDGAVSVARYRYHDHVCERFAVAFVDTVGRWCSENGIALTGHMMSEPTLSSQTCALGEVMRHYRAFHIPGIDILCDKMELTTAKQAQSAARQYGRPGVLSELYGVTNWSFDFAGHKRQGDWQTALGVLFRVPHLSWVSMAGEAKRDYPASISYQSPWWQQYRIVEDHFARVCSIMSRGRPHVRIGVLHPVESAWLCWGPAEQTAQERKERDELFEQMTSRLLFGFADFDFISESLLPTQKSESETIGFRVGEMTYDVILIPNMRTIRSTTLSRLIAFHKGGGKVLFVGEIPCLVDAQPSEAAHDLAKHCPFFATVNTSLLEALQPFCDVRLLHSNSQPVETALYQLRKEGQDQHLFVCNTDRSVAQRNLELQLRGEWKPTLLDSMDGNVRDMFATYRQGWTCIPCDLEAHGSLLIHLEAGKGSATDVAKHHRRYEEQTRLCDPVPISLSEPNVLILDYAEWKLDTEETWKEKTPILEIDPLIRSQLGLPDRGGNMEQPWVDKEPLLALATVRLKFGFSSRIPIHHAQLALENRCVCNVFLDGRPQKTAATGSFTDDAIETIALEAFSAGEHILEVELPYHRKTEIESLFLLGDFGVALKGRHTELIEPVRTLAFGNWTHQGLPFYAGNVTYHCSFYADGKPIAIDVPHFKGALVDASLDAEKPVPLAFAPFRVDYDCTPGKHSLDITVYGNRANAFGQLHHCLGGGKAESYWWSPATWRTKGKDWMDEYQLWPMGLLSAPRVLTAHCL